MARKEHGGNGGFVGGFLDREGDMYARNRDGSWMLITRTGGIQKQMPVDAIRFRDLDGEWEERGKPTFAAAKAAFAQHRPQRASGKAPIFGSKARGAPKDDAPAEAPEEGAETAEPQPEEVVYVGVVTEGGVTYRRDEMGIWQHPDGTLITNDGFDKKLERAWLKAGKPAPKSP